MALIDNPDLSVEELAKIIVAPDFPTGGTIYGYDGVMEAYTTGRGRILIRAKAEIETKGEHELIVVREIPYGVCARRTSVYRMAAGPSPSMLPKLPWPSTSMCLMLHD